MASKDSKSGDKGRLVALGGSVRTSTRDAFREFCRRRGRVQADLLSAVIEWLMTLDTTTFALVLDEIESDDRPAVAMAVLARIISKADPEQVRKLRRMMDQMESQR